MKEYKPIIVSLIRFFAVYLVITGFYYIYLTYYQKHLFTCDPFTKIVSEHSSTLLKLIGINSSTFHFNQDDYMLFFINGKKVSRVNEGCNALSVIILYLSFIIAFASNWKQTFLYILFTSNIIYIANIIRIAFINYVFYYYPEFGKVSHDYVFPAIIYGMIIILWIIWIRFFIFNDKK